MVAALVIGGLLLASMAVTAGYAARTLPPGARVPLNAGVPEYSVWLPRLAGLAAWLGIGAAAFAALTALTLSGQSASWAQSLRVVLLPGVMTVVLAAEAGAVIVARRQADCQPGPGQPDTAQPDTAQPDTGQPGTAQPGTAQPGTGQLDTGQPGTETPAAPAAS